MSTRSKAVLATIAAITVSLLAGCAEEPPQVAPATPGASVSATPAAAEDKAVAFANDASTAVIGLVVLDVVDPRTFVVGPDAREAETNGYAGEITVQINPGYNVVTPLEGECGYDESLAFALLYFSEHPDRAYVDAGKFGSDEYFGDVIQAGFAYVPNFEGRYVMLQETAQATNAGLWGICAGYGS